MGNCFSRGSTVVSYVVLWLDTETMLLPVCDPVHECMCEWVTCVVRKAGKVQYKCSPFTILIITLLIKIIII